MPSALVSLSQLVHVVSSRRVIQPRALRVHPFFLGLHQLGFGVFIWLVKVAPLPLLGTYAYVNPVVAVVLGHFLLAEQVTLRTLIGGGVIILGVALIVASQSRERGRTARREAAAEAVTFSAKREGSTARR